MILTEEDFKQHISAILKTQGTGWDTQTDAIVKLIMQDREAFSKQAPSDTSDGYHTFEELYTQRLLYNAALFNSWGNEGEMDVHKSWHHSDGELAFGGGWFIVVAELPSGQISQHYEEKFWDLFEIDERDIPNEYDGHTPEQANDRLAAFVMNEEEPGLGARLIRK